VCEECKIFKRCLVAHEVTFKILRVKKGSGKKWGGRNGLDRRTRDTTADRRVIDHKNNNLASALHVEIFRCENVSFILQASFLLPSFYTSKAVR
jgi:hypothetical protein